MSVNKIVTKVDGTINKTIDFNDLKAGLASGAHTITVEAYNGATLISSQTRNITIADTNAPTILSATVEDANPNKLVVVFSEVVDITDVTGLTITGDVTPTLSAPTGTGTDIITFTLSAALTNGQSVTLNVASSNTIKDAASNALVATTIAITNNVAAAGYEAETTAYINRVNTDTGAVINEAYVDSIYKKIKDNGSLANLLFWMDAKGGMKKDASNFISKTYDLSSSLNDPTQITDSYQPVLNTNIVFDGAEDRLNSLSLTTAVDTTFYIRFSTNTFGKSLAGKAGTNSTYLIVDSSTTILFQGDTSGVLSWIVDAITVGAMNDLFLVRNSTGYTLYINGVSYGHKPSTTTTANFTLLGNYNASGFAYNGSIQKVALFNEILTPTKMNNLITL